MHAAVLELRRVLDDTTAGGPLTNALIGFNIDAPFASRWKRRKVALTDLLNACDIDFPSDPEESTHV